MGSLAADRLGIPQPCRRHASQGWVRLSAVLHGDVALDQAMDERISGGSIYEEEGNVDCPLPAACDLQHEAILLGEPLKAADTCVATSEGEKHQ
mmetsp:Transcript_77605/g.179966  ORF Transcript_77605/g.179966 Transcript_77605/m.179966 type:complete len:94 (+) Transcript_77605:408-689(+)